MTGPGPATISVVLATCNGLPHLEAQLTSIREQTRPPDEIVVVDDESEDASLDTVSRVLDGCGAEVRIFPNSERLGPAANFGRGIRRATGGLIVLCDQDDLWREDKLARLESVLLTTEALAACSDGRLVDSKGFPLGGMLWERAGFVGSRRRRWDRGDHLGALLQGNVVTGATMAFRATLRDLVLPIPTDAWHDQWIALLAAATGTIVAIPDPLIDYRLHGQNTMGLPSRRQLERAVNGIGPLAPREPDIRRLEDVRDRLLERGSNPQAVPRIAAKIRHLQSRAALPAARCSRILPVVREAASGRYHRYASGSRSVAADLVRKSAPRLPPPS